MTEETRILIARVRLRTVVVELDHVIEALDGVCGEERTAERMRAIRREVALYSGAARGSGEERASASPTPRIQHPTPSP